MYTFFFIIIKHKTIPKWTKSIITNYAKQTLKSTRAINTNRCDKTRTSLTRKPPPRVLYDHHIPLMHPLAGSCVALKLNCGICLVTVPRGETRGDADRIVAARRQPVPTPAALLRHNGVPDPGHHRPVAGELIARCLIPNLRRLLKKMAPVCARRCHTRWLSAPNVLSLPVATDCMFKLYLCVLHVPYCQSACSVYSVIYC